MRVYDLPLCAHQPLRDRGFGDQERARDLRRGEADDASQRERDLRLARERGVAAREDKLEPLVGNVHVQLGGLGGSEGGTAPLNECELLAIARVAAEAVDPVALRHDEEPGAGVARDPVPRPVLERADERVLDALLGDVEIAEGADERRGEPAGLLAEDLGHRGVGRLTYGPRARLAPLDDRPYLDAARRPALRERDRRVQVLLLDDAEAAHGLLRFEERAVGHEDLAVLLADRRRGPRGLELLAALEVAVLRVVLPPLPDRLVGVHGRGRAVGFAEALVVDEQEYVLGHWLPLFVGFQYDEQRRPVSTA